MRGGQYWRVEDLKSFDEFPGTAVPGIEREGVLPSGHTRTPAAGGEAGTKAGWMVKGQELAKVVRKDGQHFACAHCLHKARDCRSNNSAESSGIWRRRTVRRQQTRLDQGTRIGEACAGEVSALRLCTVVHKALFTNHTFHAPAR